ncbi:MAG: hypothetical protein KDC71_05360 [Acidobacteria bacterium]|nr:hypothetical protein [Acidobacteriota bacterium]
MILRLKWINLLLLVGGLVFSQEFDAQLAQSLGADEYGMKMYSFVILKTGPTQIEDQEASAKLMRGHLDNIRRLAQEGQLIVAGPFGKNELNYRGLFILTTDSPEKAHELLKTDPAIAAGVFEVEIIPWYGGAALGTYLETQKRITKTNP